MRPAIAALALLALAQAARAQVTPWNSIPASTPAPTSTSTSTVPTALQRKVQRAEEAGKAGDWRGALFAWQEVANLDPRNAAPRQRLAETYERLGYWGEAAKQWELAAALDPPGAEARRRAELARVAARENAPPAAGPSPAPVPARGQTPAAAPYEAGVALIGQGKYAEALASLDEAVRLDPRLPEAYTARASALFGLARYVEAAGDYRTALALDPAPATPLFGLGECYRLLGQGATAADFYARYAASTAPDAQEPLRAEARKRLAELGR